MHGQSQIKKRNFKQIFANYILLITLCLSACTKDNKSSSGNTGDRSLCSNQTKVSNGSTCSSPEQSAVVMLGLTDQSGQLSGLCSGTLITPTEVLTAAHCLDKRLGIYDVYVDATGNYDFVKASEKHIHPNWLRYPGDAHDIGVVKLSSAINTRQTASLLISKDVNVGDKVDIYGYGLDEKDNAGRLKTGQMKISEIAFNGALYAEYNDTGMSICSGDSGGPVTAIGNDGVGIVGVNSAGSAEGCLKNSVALFVTTQDSSNLSFITDMIPQARAR